MYASRIPFNSEITIGDKLLRVYNEVLECRFRPEEQLLYDSYRNSLVTRVVKKDSPRQPFKWSFGTLRKLSLDYLWTEFHHIESFD